MKKLIKFLMVAFLALGSTTLFAQKFGRIDYQSIVFTMPEIATVQTDLQKVAADYQEHIESMHVEVNRKIDEVSKLPETTSATSKQLKNSEIVELQGRIQEYYNTAQQEIQKAEADLMQPLMEKVNAAIEKVSKAQNIVVVFQIGSVIYIDEAATTDITAAVKTELGIPADAVPNIPAQ